MEPNCSELRSLCINPKARMVRRVSAWRSHFSCDGKVIFTWSPSAAPAVVHGADGELREPDTAADGPKQ